MTLVLGTALLASQWLCKCRCTYPTLRNSELLIQKCHFHLPVVMRALQHLPYRCINHIFLLTVIYFCCLPFSKKLNAVAGLHILEILDICLQLTLLKQGLQIHLAVGTAVAASGEVIYQYPSKPPDILPVETLCTPNLDNPLPTAMQATVSLR